MLSRLSWAEFYLRNAMGRESMRNRPNSEQVIETIMLARVKLTILYWTLKTYSILTKIAQTTLYYTISCRNGHYLNIKTLYIIHPILASIDEPTQIRLANSTLFFAGYNI